MKSDYELIPSDRPGFGTLLWDNIKTTNAFGATPTGIVTGTGAGFFSLMFGAPEAGFAIGFAASVVTVAPLMTLFAIPFAISAKQTRKFQAKNEIENSLNQLAAIIDKQIQETMIQSIVKEDNKNSWGIRSYTSYLLKSTLKNENISVDQKWGALNNYLNEQSSEGKYVNNGKKLFNTALSVIKAKAREIKISNTNIKEELEAIKRIVSKDSWKKEGYGLFSNHFPTGVKKLREFFKKYPNEKNFDDPNFLRELKAIIYRRGSNADRTEKTSLLYETIKNLGSKNNKNKLHLLEESLSENSSSTNKIIYS